jgi:hypothetical protein
MSYLTGLFHTTLKARSGLIPILLQPCAGLVRRVA